jgi:peptide deformylase
MTARICQHEIGHLEGKLFYNEANRYHREKAFRDKIKLDKRNKNR